MPHVLLHIGGHGYTVACRAGGEERLIKLGRLIDSKIEEARTSLGTASQVRQLLFAALLLADQVGEARSPPEGDHELSAALAALADRVEAMADGLEELPPSA